MRKKQIGTWSGVFQIRISGPNPKPKQMWADVFPEPEQKRVRIIVSYAEDDIEPKQIFVPATPTRKSSRRGQKKRR